MGPSTNSPTNTNNTRRNRPQPERFGAPPPWGPPPPPPPPRRGGTVPGGPPVPRGGTGLRSIRVGRTRRPGGAGGGPERCPRATAWAAGASRWVSSSGSAPGGDAASGGAPTGPRACGATAAEPSGPTRPPRLGAIGRRGGGAAAGGPGGGTGQLAGSARPPRGSRWSFTSAPFSGGRRLGARPLVALGVYRAARTSGGSGRSLRGGSSSRPRARSAEGAQYVGLDQMVPVAGTADLDHVHRELGVGGRHAIKLIGGASRAGYVLEPFAEHPGDLGESFLAAHRAGHLGGLSVESGRAQ